MSKWRLKSRSMIGNVRLFCHKLLLVMMALAKMLVLPVVKSRR